MPQHVYVCQGIFKIALKLAYIADQNQRERTKDVPFWVSGAVLGLVRRVAVRLDRRYGIRSRLEKRLAPPSARQVLPIAMAPDPPGET